MAAVFSEQISTSGIIVAVIAGLVVVTLAVLSIVSMLKGKKRGQDLLTTHPDAARIYTRLSVSMKDALRQSIGSTAEIRVVSVDGQSAGFLVDQSGGFAPVLAGSYTVRFSALIRHPGLMPETHVADINLALAPYQCVYVGFDKSQKAFFTQDAGFSYQFT